MSTKFIAKAVEFVGDSFAVSAYPVGDARRLAEFAREHGRDRRYTIKSRAMSTNGNGWVSGIMEYQGVRYYAYRVHVGRVYVEVCD
jgi:hypothetical protein